MFSLNPFSKKTQMPSQADALKGRTEPLHTARDHFVNGHPLKGPYPEEMQKALKRNPREVMENEGLSKAVRKLQQPYRNKGLQGFLDEDALRRTLEACQDDLKGRAADALRAAAERDAA